MTIKTASILKLLHILSWIIFIGLCIQAGGFLFNTFFTLFINPVGAHRFWKTLDLSDLLEKGKIEFITVTTLMIIVSLLKAVLFYLIVKIFHDRRLNMAQPFNAALGRYLFNISYLSFGIALFSYWGYRKIQGLSAEQVRLPDIPSLGLGGAEVWLLTGVILFIFGKVFQRGMEIQSENELTI